MVTSWDRQMFIFQAHYHFLIVDSERGSSRDKTTWTLFFCRVPVIRTRQRADYCGLLMMTGRGKAEKLPIDLILTLLLKELR